MTTDSAKQMQTFTVASLNNFVRSQYQVDSVRIERVSAATSGLGIVTNIVIGTIAGPTAPLTVGQMSTVRTDLYNVSMTMSHANVMHSVSCKLKFVDQEPTGKVQLQKCHSNSANFVDAERTFDEVGLKTTSRKKVDIPKAQ